MKDDLRDKAIEKLVTSRLRAHVTAQSQAQTEGCLKAESLAAYVEHALAPGERLSCEAHLAACLSCQEQLAQLIRMSAAEEAAGREVAAPLTKTGLRTGLLRWAWAAPALVVLVVTGLWYRGEFRQRLRLQQETAANQAAPQSQTTATTTPPPARQYADQVLGGPREEKKEMSSSAPLPAPKIASPLNKGVGRGTGGASKHPSAGGAEVRAAIDSGAIATPSERARLVAPALGGTATARSSELNYARSAPAAAPAPARPPDSAHQDEIAAQKVMVESKAREVQPFSPDRSAAGLAAAKTSALSMARNWRVGPHGVIQKAGPRGWVTATSGVEADLYDITFASPSVGWAVGQAATTLRTTDGGATWSPLPVPTTEDLVHVTATSDQAARVVTRSGRVITTTDGGKSWIFSPQE